MNSDRAIADLQARIDGEFGIKGKDDCEDLKMGKEALKAYQKSQANGWYPPGYKLPGETED